MESVVFAIQCSGFRPRLALEGDNGAESRLDKIVRIIHESDYGIHDISRVEQNALGLPRLNMAFEAGLFLGAHRYGTKTHKHKAILVMDTDHRRYRDTISDLSGIDIKAHNGNSDAVIKLIRVWLDANKPENHTVMGVKHINEQFELFSQELPALCEAAGMGVDELDGIDGFRVWMGLSQEWLIGRREKIVPKT